MYTCIISHIFGGLVLEVNMIMSNLSKCLPSMHCFIVGSYSSSSKVLFFDKYNVHGKSNNTQLSHISSNMDSNKILWIISPRDPPTWIRTIHPLQGR